MQHEDCVNLVDCGYFAMHEYQGITLYTVNMYNFWQLYLSQAGKVRSTFALHILTHHMFILCLDYKLLKTEIVSFAFVFLSP